MNYTRQNAKSHAFAHMRGIWAAALMPFRDDLSIVEAEFIRPRAWIESLGLVKGARLDLAVPELEIDGLAEVTAVRDCPPIAEGEGRVVTGKFVTRDVANVVRVTLVNGTEIRATDVHPVWSVDREDWVPAGKLEPGEQVDTLEGPVAVANVERLESRVDVHNIEVHGEHVFRVTADGVLVHNACPNPGGRLGDTATRAKTSEVIQDLLSRGFLQINTEVRFRPGAGGSGRTRFADVVGRNPITGETEIVQIGRTLKVDPRVPVMRERKALDDLTFSPDIGNITNLVIRFVDVRRLGVIQP